MMEHLTETQANDYLDGVLTNVEHTYVETHVASCAQCRSDLEAMRRVLSELQGLPRAIRPERELLSGIHEVIDREQVVPLRGWRNRSFWSMRWAVATAAVLLIVATAVVTQAVAKKYRTAPMATTSPTGSALLVNREVDQLESEFQGAITELQQLIEAQRAELSPVTLRILEENLRIIDNAIRESRAALEQDPANEMINDMLWSAYEKKLELLRRATAVTST